MAVSGVTPSIDTSSYQQPQVSTAAPGAYAAATGAQPNLPANGAVPASAPAGSEQGDLTSVISSLGINSAGAAIYNASGRLNSGVAGQVAAPLPPANADVPAGLPDFTDITVMGVGTLYDSTETEGVYTPSGALQELPMSAANDASNTLIDTHA